MEPLSKIREELRRYVDGKMDYPAFRPWIAEVYCEHAKQQDSDEVKLCRAIEWECADYSEDLISEKMLRDSLRGLLPESQPPQNVGPVIVIADFSAVSSLAPYVSSFAGASGSYLPSGVTSSKELVSSSA